MPDPYEPRVANPQIQTDPSPVPPPNDPFLAPQPPEQPQEAEIANPAPTAYPAPTDDPSVSTGPNGTTEHGPHGVEGMVTPMGTTGAQARSPDPQRNRAGTVTQSAPAFDEAALRDREMAVERREDALNQRLARRREITTTELTDRDVEGQIVGEYSACAWDAFGAQPNVTAEAERALRSTTICVLILRNGFPIVGTSVAAAPESYSHGDGLKWAKQDAIARLWLCEEYANRNRIMGLEVPPDEVVADPRDPAYIPPTGRLQ